MAGLQQRFGYGMYKAGFDRSALDTATNQLQGFISLAGTSQFNTIGRGKYLIEQAQKHLPDPSHDSPQEAYNKLNDLNNIFRQELQSQADRQNRDVHTGQATGKKVDVTTQAYQPPAPGSTGMGVSLAKARTLDAYKGKSDDEITAAIKAQGHTVLP